MPNFPFTNYFNFKISEQIACSFGLSLQSLLINKIGQGPFAIPEANWHGAAHILMVGLSFCPYALRLSKN